MVTDFLYRKNYALISVFAGQGGSIYAELQQLRLSDAMPGSSADWDIRDHPGLHLLGQA
jgi:hypothetical protein